MNAYVRGYWVGDDPHKPEDDVIWRSRLGPESIPFGTLIALAWAGKYLPGLLIKREQECVFYAN